MGGKKCYKNDIYNIESVQKMLYKYRVHLNASRSGMSCEFTQLEPDKEELGGGFGG